MVVELPSAASAASVASAASITTLEAAAAATDATVATVATVATAKVTANTAAIRLAPEQTTDSTIAVAVGIGARSSMTSEPTSKMAAQRAAPAIATTCLAASTFVPVLVPVGWERRCGAEVA